MDLQGNIVGHIPLAQYDKINGVKGRDPFDSYINLGSDTGLKHSFVDTNVTNGLPSFMLSHLTVDLCLKKNYHHWKVQ